MNLTTPQSDKGGEPRGVQTNLSATRLMAKNLQRRDWTLSEIAVELECSRTLIEQILYWDLVLP